MNLKTIAQKAGVSTATVSNVINGNHHKVSRATIEKVQRIIADMEYSPNATARSLASRRSRIIGVVVANIDSEENFFSNPHYAHLLALLERHIRNEGYYMMLRCVGRCSESISLFSSWNVDGMIFFGTVTSDVEEVKNSIRVPSVFIDAYAQEGQDIANVGIDDYKGGYLSGKYLLENGHRCIAAVGSGMSFYGVMGQRFRGLCQACGEYGVEVPWNHVFDCRTEYSQGVEVGRAIARSPIPFTAVASMSDIVAFGILEGLRMEGKRVPEDVSVIGFDNLLECQYTYPKLTTVSQNTEQKALRVSQRLLRMLRGEQEPTGSEISDVSVMVRDSVKDVRK